jgi:hypothetical protein
VLVSIGAAFGIVAAIPLSIELGITRGLSAFFVGILAGVNAYNIHVAQPASRRLFVPLQFGSFVFLLCLTRLTGAVLPRGFPRQFGLTEIIVGLSIVAVCFGYVEWRTIRKPDEERISDQSILNQPDNTQDAAALNNETSREIDT